MRRPLITVMTVILSCGIAGIVSGGPLRMKTSILPAPADFAQPEITFFEPSGNKALDAEETGKLSVTLKNIGKGDAFDVKAEVKLASSVKGLTYTKQIDFGTIPAGAARTGMADFVASEEIPTGDVKVSIVFNEANGFAPDPLNVSFKTRAFVPPELVVADIGINDANGNRKVEPGETVEAVVRVQNLGNGAARGVTVELETGANVFVHQESRTRTDIGALGPGEYRDVSFTFYTNRKIGNGERIPISARIVEARPRFASTKDLGLVMNAPPRTAGTFVFDAPEPTAPKGPQQAATGLSVDVDVEIPQGEIAGEYDLAVVIGNRNYEVPGVFRVEYADRDAVMVREYLVNTFGFRPGNIYFEADASLSKFNSLFGPPGSPDKGRIFKLAKASPVKPNLFVYYVGHGAPDQDAKGEKDAYFLPVDADPKEVGSNGYRLQSFYANLAAFPVKTVTVVLDACFAANSEKGMLIRGISPGMLQVKKEYSIPENVLIFTSGSPDQVSSWYPEKRHSLFTYYFLKGIRGEADANRDRAITVGEMRAYLDAKVPLEAQRLRTFEQNPVVTGRSDSEVLVRLKK